MLVNAPSSTTTLSNFEAQLASTDQIRVSQASNWLVRIFGISTAINYSVTSDRSVIARIEERADRSTSGRARRALMRTSEELDLRMNTASGEEICQIQFPAGGSTRVAEANIPGLTPIKFREDSSLARNRFLVESESTSFSVEGTYGKFSTYRCLKNGSEFATLTRTTPWIDHFLSSHDTFDVIWQATPSPREKLVLILACVFLDFAFFDDNIDDRSLLSRLLDLKR